MEVSRDELESPIAEALMRDFAFRPKRRNWTATAEQDRRRARICAAAILPGHCGLRWPRRRTAATATLPQELRAVAVAGLANQNMAN
jgi:hypothetical protein